MSSFDRLQKMIFVNIQILNVLENRIHTMTHRRQERTILGNNKRQILQFFLEKNEKQFNVTQKLFGLFKQSKNNKVIKDAIDMMMTKALTVRNRNQTKSIFHKLHFIMNESDQWEYTGKLLEKEQKEFINHTKTSLVENQDWLENLGKIGRTHYDPNK